MVDEILARVGLLRHGPLWYVLESEMTVEINHRRHDGFARQVDAHRPGTDRHLTPAADPREMVILDDECRIFDGCAAVASYQPPPFEHGRSPSCRGRLVLR